MEAVMSGDSAERVTESRAAHFDDEFPRANENPGPNALDRTRPQEMSPPLHDDYTTADIRTLLHRLYALASQI
jgi:hypothetical protein